MKNNEEEKLKRGVLYSALQRGKDEVSQLAGLLAIKELESLNSIISSQQENFKIQKQ